MTATCHPSVIAMSSGPRRRNAPPTCQSRAGGLSRIADIHAGALDRAGVTIDGLGPRNDLGSYPLHAIEDVVPFLLHSLPAWSGTVYALMG